MAFFITSAASVFEYSFSAAYQPVLRTDRSRQNTTLQLRLTVCCCAKAQVIKAWRFGHATAAPSEDGPEEAHRAVPTHNLKFCNDLESAYRYTLRCIFAKIPHRARACCCKSLRCTPANLGLRRGASRVHRYSSR